MKLRLLIASLLTGLALHSGSLAAIIINEVVYDDGGTDDREFVELYNSGPAAVDISNWIVRNSDTVAPPGDNNADHTIPAGTSLAAGDYYVIGMTGVLEVKKGARPGEAIGVLTITGFVFKLDGKDVTLNIEQDLGAEKPVTVDDISPIATSFPDFLRLMGGLGAAFGETPAAA